MKIWLTKITLAAAFLLSISAQAAVITDVVAVDTYVGNWGSTTWTHDINDQGFVWGSAESASISIQFWDDQKWDLPELASIIIGTIDFHDGEIIYNAVSDWSGALGFNSLASLNANGLLQVKVWSLLGDFRIGNSTLNVTTADAVSVPESGSIVLLALGLLGLAVLRRKSL